MHSTVQQPITALLAFLIVIASASPAVAHGKASDPGLRRRTLRTDERIDLYSPRVRRSTVMYLRLRLLELREAGLDRARAAIERRLSVDELIAGPPRPPQPAPPHIDDVRTDARRSPLPAPEKPQHPRSRIAAP